MTDKLKNFKINNLKMKKKKTSPGSKKQLMKTLSRFKSMGIPIGFIKDKLIGGAGTDYSTHPVTGRSLTADQAAGEASRVGKKQFQHGDKFYKVEDYKVSVPGRRGQPATVETRQRAKEVGRPAL